MRASLTMVAALVAFATLDHSFALEASDTMAVWKGASAEDKSKLVKKLLKQGGSARIISCLDAASSVPGHQDLPISEIVKACEQEGGEPV